MSSDAFSTILTDEAGGTFFYHIFHTLRSQGLFNSHNLEAPRLRLKQVSTTSISDSIQAQNSLVFLLSYSRLAERLQTVYGFLGDSSLNIPTKFIIDYSNESGSFDDLDSVDNIFSRNPNWHNTANVYFLCQNRMLLSEKHNKINVLMFDAFIVSCWASIYSKLYGAKDSIDQLVPFVDPKSKAILSLNATPRYHRTALCLKLFENFNINGQSRLRDLGVDDNAFMSCPGFGYRKSSGESIEGFVDYLKANKITVDESCLESFLSHLPFSLDNTCMSGNELANEIPYELFSGTAFSVVTETGTASNHKRITEKTFKALALGHPVLVLGHPRSLRLAKDLGLTTFDEILNHSYDQDLPLSILIQRIISEAKSLIQRLDSPSLCHAINDEATANCRWIANGFIQKYHEDYFVPIFDVVSSISWRPALVVDTRSYAQEMRLLRQSTFEKESRISQSLTQFRAQVNAAANSVSRVMYSYCANSIDLLKQCEESIYIARRFTEERILNIPLGLSARACGIKMISLGEGCLSRTLLRNLWATSVHGGHLTLICA